MDAKGKRTRARLWCTGRGRRGFVHHCPTFAIQAENADAVPGSVGDNQQESLDVKTPEERAERPEIEKAGTA